MPIYTFVHEPTGEVREEMFSGDEAPKIGDKIRRAGKTWIRTFSGHIDAGVARKVHKYPFVSESLPRGCCPESQDSKERPVIRSQTHEREVLSRMNYVRM